MGRSIVVICLRATGLTGRFAVLPKNDDRQRAARRHEESLEKSGANERRIEINGPGSEFATTPKHALIGTGYMDSVATIERKPVSPRTTMELFPRQSNWTSKKLPQSKRSRTDLRWKTHVGGYVTIRFLTLWRERSHSSGPQLHSR